MTENKKRKRPSFNIENSPQVKKEETPVFTLTPVESPYFRSTISMKEVLEDKEETLSDLLNPVSQEDTQETISLSDLLNEIKDIIEESAGDTVWVKAEIAKFKKDARSGHLYLELIDRDSYGSEKSKINAMVWSSNAKRISDKFEKATHEKLKDGIKCEWLVRISYNIKYGLSLTISDVKPLWSIGEHEKKKEEIRKQLKEEGLWWNQSQLKAPSVITRIAIIAPSEAAGLGDFISESEKWSQSGIVGVDLFNAVFEGDKASSSIQQAFTEIAKRESDFYRQNNSNLYDLVIILRGGGAKTSLAWLDDYGIMYQLLKQTLPVWSAIGHEQDLGLIDEVSSLSLHTPSKAAQRIWEMIQQEYYTFSQAWDAISNERVRRCDKLSNNIDNVFDNITYEAYQRIDNLKIKTTELSREAITLGPQATLQRGYAIITGDTNQVIKSATEANKQSALKIRWYDSEKKINNKEEK